MATQRERWSWYLYDFGNSAYAAVILLAVYAAYYKEQVVGGARGTWYWGLAVGIAMLVVAVIAPILGAIADFSGTKKRFLFLFTSMSVIFTGTLYFVQRGDVILGMVLFILAEIGYRAGQVFYNALLPEFTTADDIGKVSGIGWAIGSFGGIVCLLIILPLIMFVKGENIVRLTFVITSVFFALSAMPLFLFLRERSSSNRLPAGSSYLVMGLRRLRDTFLAVRSYKEFIKFIIAFLIYNDGIIMALDFAAIIGAVMFGMSQQQLIIMMIIVQVTSVAGAYIFGMLSGKLGFKITLVSSLILMMLAVIWMIINFNSSYVIFIVIAGLAGFALTGVQSLSRAMVGALAPLGKSAEFYGFFEVGGRTSSFIGPSVYGFIAGQAAHWFQNRNTEPLLAEQLGHRLAMYSILLFLVVGTLLLLFVKSPVLERKKQLKILEAKKEPVL